MVTLIFIVVGIFVLYGLIASTEKRLIQRQHVVIDERSIEHRSRL